MCYHEGAKGGDSGGERACGFNNRADGPMDFLWSGAVDPHAPAGGSQKGGRALSPMDDSQMSPLYSCWSHPVGLPPALRIPSSKVAAAGDKNLLAMVSAARAAGAAARAAEAAGVAGAAA